MSVREADQLLEIANGGGLESVFEKTTLSVFWIKVTAENPEIATNSTKYYVTISDIISVLKKPFTFISLDPREPAVKSWNELTPADPTGGRKRQQTTCTESWKYTQPVPGKSPISEAGLLLVMKSSERGMSSPDLGPTVPEFRWRKTRPRAERSQNEHEITMAAVQAWQRLSRDRTKCRLTPVDLQTSDALEMLNL
ncbi:unnamed protein product [Pleuronectes platessa]|uniref:Uncharacterized protein n=1 Tax=Pleuronectes platessa TaxID=8262 RepID=A0A9N7Z0T8_PLEPL|nr:unnamed protein product [Pleuronectes platessa]